MKTRLRYVSAAVVLSVLVLLLGSCQISDSWRIVRLKGEPKTVTVPLGDSGDIGLSVDLNFTGGGGNTITVLPTADGEAPYAVMTYPADLEEWGLSTVMDNGVLTVDVLKNRQFSTDAFAMTVYANVTSYDLVGSYTLEADHGDAPSAHLSLNITGGAAVTICRAAAESVTVCIDGAADVVMTGRTELLDITINGAGALDTVGMDARDASVVINGVGAARLACTDTLDAEIIGAGTVSYTGNPTLKKEINGLGSVSALSDETT